MSHRIFLTAAALALVLPLYAAGAQDTTRTAADSMVIMRATAVKWAPLDVPGFKPGIQLGVIAGDPSKPGPYTLRLRFPSGYAFPPHWHPVDENLTVISGQFFLGMGEKSDRTKMRAYVPGDYLLLPATKPHFGRVVGRTVVQLHGTGPFEIKLVEQPAGASRQ